MVKKILGICLGLALCVPAFALEKRHQFELAAETSAYTYKEPHLDHPMKLTGAKYGASAVYTRRSLRSAYVTDEDPTFARLELRYMTGDVDYDGWKGNILGVGTDFSASNLRDYYVEAALKAGWKFQLTQPLSLSPYLGIGWRYLRNHLEESGEGGYLRTSTYIYMPLGLQAAYQVTDRFSLALNGQFDWLLSGQQFSDDSSGGVYNDQDKGYGVRVSVKAQAELGKVGVFVEPFWRYWQIQNSQPQYFKVWYLGAWHLVEEREPYNKTQEWGIRAGITF